jgi:hypothetical protein
MTNIRDQYWLLPKLQEALRQRVCSVCVDRSLDGPCAVDTRHECALFNNLPRIARSISSVQSDKISDYVAAIRQDVCDICIHERLDGSCKEREEVRCVLDRYLIPIVQTIEEITGAKLEAGGLLVH